MPYEAYFVENNDNGVDNNVNVYVSACRRQYKPENT